MQERHFRRQALRAAFPYTLPVLMGFGLLGTTYGVLMQAQGYGAGWAVAMSALAFCGSMQFVALTLLSAAFDPVQAFLLSLMVNARHLFYGVSMLEKYRELGKIRAFFIFGLCDETFSIVSSLDPPPGIDRKYFYLSVTLLDYLYWVGGTALGGLLGSVLQLDIPGLDFVLTALFVVLLLEQVRKPSNRPAAAVGILAAVAALLLFGADNMVLPAMGILLVILGLGRWIKCR